MTVQQHESQHVKWQSLFSEPLKNTSFFSGISIVVRIKHSTNGEFYL